MKFLPTAIIAIFTLSACTISQGEWLPEPEAENDSATSVIADEVESGSEDENGETENNQDKPAPKAMVSAIEKPLVQARASKKQQIRQNVTNDYYVFQALNHQFIKSNQTERQYQELETVLSHFVMDLIANMTPESFNAPLVVRPMKLNAKRVANPEAGKDLLTSLIVKQMKEYGFIVFDARKPKGKFTGDELLLETVINKHGEQYVLSGTLKLLSSNKVAGTNQTFISDYFFRNMQDGVEVYR